MVGSGDATVAALQDLDGEGLLGGGTVEQGHRRLHGDVPAGRRGRDRFVRAGVMVDKPLPTGDELEAEENLDGHAEKQLATFQQLTVPQPGGVLREAAVLTNAARLEVPTTIICSGFPYE